ncbi:MAG: sulfatase-like hydrolase/transferase [Bacteroidales bacterium]|nr:sulfatase-like hydrolase/transferase [Bacteroidales bacterium]
MKNNRHLLQIWFVFKQYIFWMLFFQFLRSIFLIYNINEAQGNNFIEIIRAFTAAFALDNSAAGYIMMLPLVLGIFKSLFFPNIFFQATKFYHYLIIVIAVSISIAELPLYDEWKVKLNFKAISYLVRPMEVFQTASAANIIFGTIAILLITVLAIIVFNRYVAHKKYAQTSWIAALAHIILLPVFFIWGIRGGLQPIPVHLSDAYYSKSYFLNLVAVNSQWNVMNSVVKNFKYKNTNPYKFFSDNDATNTVNEIHHVAKDTTIEVLNTNRPNIILILLESWSADVIKALGGYDSITPEFDKLASEGILFENTYGTGGLSDEGISAVLSGQPSLPSVIVVNQPDKYVKMPSISKDLKKAGYYNYFIFGGQLNYGNIKSYIYSNDFDEIYEDKDLPKSLYRGRLGVHDGYLFTYFVHDLKRLRQPFFAMIFTLSSHSPYDQPSNTKFFWGGDAQHYINSVNYTDSCLGAFFKQVKQLSFYDNTLFILVSDHSHHSPRGWHPYAKEYRRIVMLWYGKVIKPEYRGYRIKKYCTQTDLAITLLKQLNVPSSQYLWSKNLLNPHSQSFAYYAYNDGFGWVSDSNYFAYLKSEDRLLFHSFCSQNDSLKHLKYGKSYIQKLFDNYLNM